MFRRQDPYSYTEYLTLYDAAEETLGMLAIEYRVGLYNDVLVQNQGSVNQPKNQQFMLHCTQRLFMVNKGNSSVAPVTNSTPETEYFSGYPALIDTHMMVKKQTGVTLNLMDYSPLTLNAAVQQTGSAGSSTGATQATSTSSTTGSSFTQSSNYGASVTAGDTFSGATASVEYATAATTDSSSSAGRESSSSAGKEISNTASMSIKDWGSYGLVNSYYVYPRWIFGQEFPWNAIDCRFALDATYPGDKKSPPNKNQYQMIISNSMAANLYDGIYLYPPSELSMFGVNFVMKSCWRVYVDDDASTQITLIHDVELYTASHILVENSDGLVPQVYMDKAPLRLRSSPTSTASQTFSTTLDLNIMSLDPVGVNNRAAIVGFLPAKFMPPVAILPPATSAALPLDFKTIAATNDLMIENSTDYGSLTASGFSVSQACLTAGWSAKQNVPCTLTLYFKVIDYVSEYTMNIKHWVTQATGVELTIVINGDTSTTITRYVTDFEGEGGDNNLMSIALRDLDFASIDYHDYLQLGLNAIAITVLPVNADYASNCSYQIRALSITQG